MKRLSAIAGFCLCLILILTAFQNCAKSLDTEPVGNSLNGASNASGDNLSIVEQYPDDTTISVYEGQDIDLFITASNPDGLTYEWSLDGQALSEDTNVLRIMGANANRDAGTYQVVITHTASGRSITSRLMGLSVDPPPAEPQAPGTPSLRATYADNNRSLTLSTNVPSGIPTPSLAWQVAQAGSTTFTDLTGETANELSLTNLTTANDHRDRYRVCARNSEGNACSAAREVYLPGVTLTPNIAAPSAGQALTISVAVTGDTTPFYRWYLDDVAFVDQGSISLVNNQVRVSSLSRAELQGKVLRVAVSDSASSPPQVNATYTFNIRAALGDGVLTRSYTAGNLRLNINQRVATRRLNLVLQGDSNLVLYTHVNGANQQAIWATNTVNRGASHMLFQSDGNLVLFNNLNQPIFASGTAGTGRTLVLPAIGTMYIQNANGGIVWRANRFGR